MPQQTRLSEISIASQEVSLSENVTGEFSTVVDIQVPQGYRYEFPAGEPLELYLMTHESFAGSSDPVNLTNNLVNSPGLTDIDASGSNSATSGASSLVVWDDSNNIQSAVDSVDYDANQFGYSQASDLEVFYLWGDSSQVEFRTYTPDEESYEKELIQSVRSFHEASVFSRESMITFDSGFTMMPKEHLKITVKTDVDLSNWDHHDAGTAFQPGDFDIYSYADFSLPVRRVALNS